MARSAATKLQLKGLNGEVLQEIDVIQHAGFASWIPEGTKVLILPINGKTSKTLAISSTAAPVVVQISEGETCIYAG